MIIVPRVKYVHLLILNKHITKAVLAIKQENESHPCYPLCDQICIFKCNVI